MKNFKFEVSEDNIAVLTFKNSRKNSFSPGASEELKEILNQANDRKCIGLIFKSGTQDFFCAGGDLKYYISLGEKKPGVEANKKITKNLELLSQLRMPTVALVDGLCVGGGVELLSCFDYVYSTNNSYFSLWQWKVGLSFGWGGKARLANRLSEANLKRHFINCNSLSSYQALKINLIDKIYSRSSIETKAKKLLIQVAGLPKEPVVLLKENTLDEQSIFEKLWLAEEHKQALNNFTKKP